MVRQEVLFFTDIEAKIGYTNGVILIGNYKSKTMHQSMRSIYSEAYQMMQNSRFLSGYEERKPHWDKSLILILKFSSTLVQRVPFHSSSRSNGISGWCVRCALRPRDWFPQTPMTPAQCKYSTWMFLKLRKTAVIKVESRDIPLIENWNVSSCSWPRYGSYHLMEALQA